MTDIKAGLSKKELRRLAKEARVLAMECVAGAAPILREYDYCQCAVGVVAVRAGIPAAGWNPDVAEAVERAAFGCKDAVDENALVSHGLRFSNPGGAVFPLLAMADALEDASKTPKSNP